MFPRPLGGQGIEPIFQDPCGNCGDERLPPVPFHCHVVVLRHALTAGVHHANQRVLTAFKNTGRIRSPLAIIALVLSGCMQATLAPTTVAGWSARDKQLMFSLPYAQATIPEEYGVTSFSMRARKPPALSSSSRQ
jgi:hypothetical protein